MEPGKEPGIDVSALMGVLLDHFTLVLATRSSDGTPYSTPLFYAVIPGPTPWLAFASDPASAHGRHLGVGPTLASAGIYREDEDVSHLRGVQLRGEVRRLEVDDPLRPAVHRAYTRRHPVATPLLTPDRRDRLYVLAVSHAKLTDNARLSLGRHASWTFPVGWDRLEITPL